MDKEQTIKLIAGRIKDEFNRYELANVFHKNNNIDWAEIAARKIYSQWNEYYVKETSSIKSELEEVKKKNTELNIKIYESVTLGSELLQQVEDAKESEEATRLAHIDDIKLLGEKLRELEEARKEVERLKGDLEQANRKIIKSKYPES